jgi:hypothetical protein
LPPLDPLLAALELPLLDGACAPELPAEPPEVEPPLPEDEFELPHATPNPAINRALNTKRGRAVI